MGTTKLYVTLEKKPSWLDTILQAVKNAQPANTTVPYLIGNTALDATQKLRTAHLRSTFTNGQSGVVSTQSIPANSSVAVNTAIGLTMTTPPQPTGDNDVLTPNTKQPTDQPPAGSTTTTVPPLKGLTLVQAQTAISAASLRPAPSEEQE